MTKTVLLSSVALLYMVAASGGCSSSNASSAPMTGSGDVTGVASNGAGAVPGTGSGGLGTGSGEGNPNGSSATQGTGGSTTVNTGGTSTTTDSGGTNTGGTEIGGTGAAETRGGSSTIDPFFGGQPTVIGGSGNTIDTMGGSGNTIDTMGGSGNTIDTMGGSGNTIDTVGGTGNTIDTVGGTGNTEDLVGGTGNTEDLVGGTGNTEDHFGGTGNSFDGVGGVSKPPPPPDAAPPPPGCIPSYFAKKINVLVLHDAKMTGADTRGGLWVGGNLSGDLGYDVGGDLPPDPSCTRYDLAVGGNITLSGFLVLHNGAAAYGGTLNVAGVTGGTCGIAHNPADMPNFTEIGAEVKSNSAYFASLPATGTVSGTTYNGQNSACKVVVFNTTNCNFDWSTHIDLPVGGTAIINSTCVNPTFAAESVISLGGVDQPKCMAQNGTGGACEHVLYNFPNAKTVTVSGGTAQGSILAPYAKFLGGGGAVAGEVVVDSMETAIEFHAWFFEGCLDTTSCK